jgi:hypothetical protein
VVRVGIPGRSEDFREAANPFAQSRIDLPEKRFAVSGSGIASSVKSGYFNMPRRTSIL